MSGAEGRPFLSLYGEAMFPVPILSTTRRLSADRGPCLERTPITGRRDPKRVTEDAGPTGMVIAIVHEHPRPDRRAPHSIAVWRLVDGGDLIRSLDVDAQVGQVQDIAVDRHRVLVPDVLTMMIDQDQCLWTLTPDQVAVVLQAPLCMRAESAIVRPPS
jgi:hypothetical protein